MNKLTDQQWKELHLKIAELNQKFEFMKQQLQFQVVVIGNQIDRINDIFEDADTGDDIGNKEKI